MAWVGGALNLIGGRRDNMFNKEEADKARDWSKDMANSEVQRRVIDMRRAGINPILAASSGGASTPGAAVSAPSTSGGSVGDTVQSAYFSAQQLKMMREKNAADVAQVQANTAKTAAETRLIEAEIPYSAKGAFFKNETLYSEMKIAASRVNQANSESEVKAMLPDMQRLINRGLELDMSEKEATSRFFKEIGEGSRWMQLVRDLLIGIRSAR